MSDIPANREQPPVNPALVQALDETLPLLFSPLRIIVCGYAHDVFYRDLVLVEAEKKTPNLTEHEKQRILFWADGFHSNTETDIPSLAYHTNGHTSLAVWAASELAVCPWFRPEFKIDVNGHGDYRTAVPYLLRPRQIWAFFEAILPYTDRLDAFCDEGQGNCVLRGAQGHGRWPAKEPKTNKKGERVRLCGWWA